ncbi:ABC transporter, ATP-binding protein [Campylobacter blaseri]|uniref:ABC transporter ATP-binding protein n=1 Tax=Campylobacter blaseri TaxID=2042961 RepID=A0A2P8QZ04_9BACT|nr:ABC transporter ATP-binding protein [Campylobacter blaseri]PSM51471.1 ABC transporter ATP-binding protein [Campylobacter blaseri]PSM52920.1 ABC transporter ATP-binding protein [Campylobacter blaseri]QKF86523.1 ABC transporter, ATP-binding protein [Campylobacter blaseri]
MQDVIEIKNLTHHYGDKKIYENLNLNIKKGEVFGILGKNGVGKSTLINILMGYLKPLKGDCLILGHKNYNLPNDIKKEIALLFEGFVSYDFFTIKQYEKFLSFFYPKWKKDIFYDLVSLMNLNTNQKLSTLSYGQKSQVVLGALFAQDASLIILDDYSMGLDAGYRRLFIDYLKDYLDGTNKSVIVTSHIMSDLSNLVSSMIIVEKGGFVHKDTMENFIQNFNCFKCNVDYDISNLNYKRVENFKQYKLIYSFENLENEYVQKIDTNFEDKFLGFVGKYE